MTARVHKLRHDMTLIGFNKDAVEKYQRWNSMLSLECDQNAYKVRSLDIDHMTDTRHALGIVTEQRKKVRICFLLLVTRFNVGRR